MLDTVRLELACPLRICLPHGQRFRLAAGIRVWTDPFLKGIRSAELSLPKVLFGHNGRVLESQSHLNAALDKSIEILSKIARVPDTAQWRSRRVDIAWNFDLPARPLIIAHASLRVPGILRGGTLHNGEQGVSWRGAKSHRMITLYDKALQMRVPGSVLRAEISLRAGQILRYLPNDNWRRFSSLYSTFRNLMTTIPPICRSVKAANFQEAVALEPPEIRARILARLAHKPMRTFRRYRQQVEAAAAQLEETFSWAEILPEDAPPVAIHVMRRTDTRP